MINLPQSERTIRVEPMFTEDRVLIVPNNHSLAGRSQLTLADLAGHELLLEPKGTFFRDQLDTYGAQHGFELHAKAEIDGLRLLASMAFAGHGAAILPATAVKLARRRMDNRGDHPMLQSGRSGSPVVAAGSWRRRNKPCSNT